MYSSQIRGKQGIQWNTNLNSYLRKLKEEHSVYQNDGASYFLNSRVSNLNFVSQFRKRLPKDL